MDDQANSIGDNKESKERGATPKSSMKVPHSADNDSSKESSSISGDHERAFSL